MIDGTGVCEICWVLGIIKLIDETDQQGIFLQVYKRKNKLYRIEEETKIYDCPSKTIFFSQKVRLQFRNSCQLINILDEEHLA